MALTKDSVLFYQDFGRGRLDPIVGGLPTFLRAGGAWKFDGRLFRKVIRNQPRFEPVELNDGRRQAGLLLEPATAQELDDPFDFSTANWNKGGNATYDQTAPSLFKGETAMKVTGDGAGSGNWLYQTAGTFTGSSETVVVVIEQGDHADFAVGIYNATTGLWVTRYRVTWADLTTTHRDGGAAEQIDVTELLRTGPNGGKVALVRLTDASTSGESRRVYVDPLDRETTTDHVFVHYAGWEENAYGSSPVSGPANTSQAIDSHRYANAPKPQRIAWYHRLVIGSRGTGVQQIFGLLGDRASWLTDPRFLWYINVSNDLALIHDDGVAPSTLSVAPSVAFEPGQDVEIVAALSTNGNIRGLIRTNGGAVQDTGVDTTNPGVPAAWGGDGDLVVGTHVDKPTRQHHARLFAVDPADLENNPVSGSGAPAEDVMEELANFYMTPAGEVV